MRIIKFEEKYRDDMIFMVLSAKNALGRVPIGKEYLESQIFYPKHGYVEYKELYMKKDIS